MSESKRKTWLEVTQIISNIVVGAGIVGIFLTFVQVRGLKTQIEDARIQEAGIFMLDLHKDLRQGVYADLSYAIATEVPILKSNKGPFTDEDLDNYLVKWEILDNLYERGLITKDMIKVAFSFDIVKAYHDDEVQDFLREVRVDQNDPTIYQGFESLAKVFDTSQEIKAAK